MQGSIFHHSRVGRVAQQEVSVFSQKRKGFTSEVVVTFVPSFSPLISGKDWPGTGKCAIVRKKTTKGRKEKVYLQVTHSSVLRSHQFLHHCRVSSQFHCLKQIFGIYCSIQTKDQKYKKWNVPKHLFEVWMQGPYKLSSFKKTKRAFLFKMFPTFLAVSMHPYIVIFVRRLCARFLSVQLSE